MIQKFKKLVGKIYGLSIMSWLIHTLFTQLKGYGSTKTSLKVHTVSSQCGFELLPIWRDNSRKQELTLFGSSFEKIHFWSGYNFIKYGRILWIKPLQVRIFQIFEFYEEDQNCCFRNCQFTLSLKCLWVFLRRNIFLAFD